VPFKFIHPMRVTRLRALNITVLVAWVVLGSVALLRGLAPGPWIVAALVAAGLYFVAVGLIDQMSKHDRPAV
jgi:phosphatidylcholine synthase